MRRKYLYSFLAFFLVLEQSLAQILTVGTAGMTVMPGTALYMDSLVLTPSSALTLTSTSLSQSATAVSTGFNNSIDKVFTFSAPVHYSGTAGMYYASPELNGNTASSLAIAYNSAAGGAYTVNCSSTVNVTNQEVTSSSLSGANLSGITAVTKTVSAAAITNSGTICQGGARALADATPGGSWSSGATGVATVGSTGVVTGVSAGTAHITYTVTNGCSTATAMATVTINPLPTVAAISGTATVCAGGAHTTLTDGTAGGAWSSASTSIATVSSSGVVTGVSGGSVAISHSVSNTCGTTSATKVVTVNPLPTVAAISGAATVCSGGAHITLTDATAGGVWSSGTAAVATISSSGVITSVSAGSATISYSVTNTCGTTRATTVVTVNGAPTVAAISGASTVCQGATIALTDATAGGAWSSSSAAVATIGSTGIVTGAGAGSATISYTVTNSCGTTRATKVVTVSALPAVAAISGAGSVSTGATTTLTDPATGGAWSASNTHATVSGGIVTGMSAGTVTISYTVSNTCGSAVATKPVTVNAATAPITGPTSVCEGATIALSDEAGGGTWSSSSTSVVLCGASGIITGVHPGTATITYTVSGSHVTAVITVNPLPAGISGSATVSVGASITLTDATAGGAWSSSTARATVVATSGVVHGVTAGSATISYTLATGCYSSKSITVTSRAARDDDSATGITNVPAAINVNVMPNPNKGVFSIKGSSGTNNAEVSLEVTDMLGQVVYRNKGLAQNGAINEQIQLNSVANGMYILTVSSGSEVKSFHIVVEQ